VNGIGHLFTAQQGVTYTLSFWLAGSQRGDVNTVDVALGDASFVISSIPSDTPSTLHSVNWLATHGGFETFTFQNRGNDSMGAILDDVHLVANEMQAAPEPGTPILLGAGLVGIALLLRRRRARLY
jgi:hypothetical protein